MKKLGFVVLICALACALFACSSGGGNNAKDYSDSEFVGSWKIDTMSLKDISESFDTEWTIQLEADGTGKSISEGETDDFTWEPTGNGFKTKGALNTTFEKEGDGIKTKVIGVELHFVRAE